MKKFIYMALSALVMGCNVSYAAAAADLGFLDGIPAIGALASLLEEQQNFEMLHTIAMVHEGLKQDKDFPEEPEGRIDSFTRLLGPRINDRDVLVMRQLVHLNNPDGVDPHAAMIAEATPRLAGIPGITPAEVKLWTYLYMVTIFKKGWDPLQMPGDVSYIAPAHVVPGNGGVPNVVVPAMPVGVYVGGVAFSVGFDRMKQNLAAAIEAYKAAKLVPAAGAGV